MTAEHDEYEHEQVSPSGRKMSKPLMEKRRRARINQCLSQLKLLVLDALQKDNCHYSKLEKADILELTVKHIRQIQRSQLAAAVRKSPISLAQYQAGFSECATEVSGYIQSVEGVPESVRARLVDHLAGSLHKLTAQLALQRDSAATDPYPSPGGAHQKSQQLLQQQQQQIHQQILASVPPPKLRSAISPDVFGTADLPPPSRRPTMMLDVQKLSQMTPIDLQSFCQLSPADLQRIAQLTEHKLSPSYQQPSPTPLSPQSLAALAQLNGYKSESSPDGLVPHCDMVSPALSNSIPKVPSPSEDKVWRPW